LKLTRTRLALRPGYLDCFGHELEQRSGAALVALAEGEPDRSLAKAIELDGQPAWFKGGPLRGRTSVRYGLRRLVGLPLPRMREYRNFLWLGERLFRVPEPLVCGALRRFGLPVYQFLVTRRIADAEPLDSALPRFQPEQRGPLVSELAREVARMHALHFVHHDLFVRNMLVTPPPPPGGDDRRLVFIDAWRGGPGYLPRGADYDLACLLLEGAALLTPFEQSLFFREYLAERAVHGAAPDRERLFRAILRRRAALLARIDREPTRWRGPGAPVRDWRPPRD